MGTETNRITKHFLDDGGQVIEIDYLVMKGGANGKTIVHFKIYGSERRCSCQDKEEIRRQLETVPINSG